MVPARWVWIGFFVALLQTKYFNWPNELRVGTVDQQFGLQGYQSLQSYYQIIEGWSQGPRSFLRWTMCMQLNWHNNYGILRYYGCTRYPVDPTTQGLIILSYHHYWTSNLISGATHQINLCNKSQYGWCNIHIFITIGGCSILMRQLYKHNFLKTLIPLKRTKTSR